MEVAGRDGCAPLQDKLRILEDLNMLYIRQIALSLEVRGGGGGSRPPPPR